MGKLLKVLVQDVEDVDLKWESGGLPWPQVLTHTPSQEGIGVGWWSGDRTIGQRWDETRVRQEMGDGDG